MAITAVGQGNSYPVSSNPSEVSGGGAVGSATAGASAPAAAPAGDATALSNDGAILAAANTKLRGTSAVREQVVRNLKQAVVEGSYAPDPRAVAAAVAQALLG